MRHKTEAPKHHYYPVGVAILILGMLCARGSDAQDASPAPKQNRIVLSIECRKQNGWIAMDAQTVFRKKDRLRFRFRSSVSGYLYILCRSSSGAVSWLYPVPGGASNHVTGGGEVIIPGAEGQFVVGGPPGFETLYWIMRSTPMKLPQIEEKQLDAPSTLVSRCPEEEVRAQVACLDKSAGPKPVADPSKLQTALGISSSLVARDLTFESKPQATEITTDSDGSSGGIIYQLRIAHN